MSREGAGATAAHIFEEAIGEQRADALARKLREQTDEIVHLSTSSGSSGDARLHVPANPEDEENTEPICSGMSSWRSPRRKDVSCFPPGWMPWCSRCAVTVLDELEVPPGIPIVAIPDGDRDE